MNLHIYPGMLMYYFTFSTNSKYLSLEIPAVVKLVLIWVTATFLGLVLITTGLMIPGLVIEMWSPLVLETVNPSASNN